MCKSNPMPIGTSTQCRQNRQLPVSYPLHEEQHEHMVNILSTASKLSRNNTPHFQSNDKAHDDGIDEHEHRLNGYTRFIDDIYSSSISACDHLRLLCCCCFLKSPARSWNVMIGDDMRRFGRIANEKAKKAAVEPCGSLQGAGDICPL